MSEPIWTVEQRPYSEVHYLLHKGTRVASFRREAWAAEAMHALNRNQAAQQQQARIEALQRELDMVRRDRNGVEIAWQAERDALTAERERAEELTRKLDVELLRRDTERPIWEQQLQAEREKAAQYRKALWKYGQHRSDCSCWIYYNGDLADPKQCSCGFLAAIAATEVADSAAMSE